MIKINHDKRPPWVLVNPRYASMPNAIAYPMKLINSSKTGKNLYVKYSLLLTIFHIGIIIVKSNGMNIRTNIIINPIYLCAL